MKIAFCFYGLVGSKSKKYGFGENLDPSIAFDYYKKNVFSQIEDYDVFIHSQSIDVKNCLLKIYKPKKFLIEKQKNFIFAAIKNKYFLRYLITMPLKFIINFFVKKKYSLNVNKLFLRCINNYSRWYSTKKVVDLMDDFQKEKKINYDLVFITRLDVAFLTPFNFSKIDKNKITVPHHNDVPSPRNFYKEKIKRNNRTFEKGISDFWFLSNPVNMIKFSKLYSRLNHYLISSHMCSFQHIRYLNLDIDFFRYRGIDHEAIRRLNRSDE